MKEETSLLGSFLCLPSNKNRKYVELNRFCWLNSKQLKNRSYNMNYAGILKDLFKVSIIITVFLYKLEFSATTFY